MMTTTSYRIDEFFRREISFLIPVFQRNYDWKKSQCEKLFLDLMDIVKKKKSNHFLGTVFCVHSDERTITEKIIIDGQQRITSLMLLLKACIDLIEDSLEKKMKIEDYLINRDFLNTEYEYKLKSVEKDYIEYKKLMNNESCNKNSRIYENYIYFYNLIKEYEILPNQIFSSIRYIDIIEITIEKGQNSQNPQEIFESLNSTGLSLVSSDLIRNYLLMNQTFEVSQKLYKKYWVEIEKNLGDNETEITKFFKDFLIMKTGILIKEKDVYEQFKRYIKYNKEINEKNILEELVQYSKIYSWMINYNSENIEINKYLYEIRLFENSTIYPLLLKLISYENKVKSIDVNEFLEILKFLTSYIFRRLVCGVASNALNTLFVSVINSLDKINNNKNFYSHIVDFIMNKSGSARFPKNEEFKEKFIKYNFYKKKKICKYLLEIIERSKNKEVVNIDNLTLEHIMPKRLSNDWQLDLGKNYEKIHSIYINTIGNLTITAYNTELSNSEFDTKKEYYNKSNIEINRELCKYEKWDDSSILDRANKMFIEIEKKYIQPKYNKNVNQLEISKYYNISKLFNVKGTKPSSLMVFDNHYYVDSWRSLYKKLCEILYEYDEEIFKSLFLHKRLKNWITNDKSKFKESFEILEKGIFVHLVASADTLLSLASIMIEEFQLEEDVFVILSKI